MHTAITRQKLLIMCDLKRKKKKKMQPNFWLMNDLLISHFLLMTWSLTYTVPKILFIITNIMLLLLYEMCVLFIPIGSAGRW